jgi:predicted TIM-barrel fold metal-dependent hydrolase
VLAGFGLRAVFLSLGGAFSGQPEDLNARLSPAASNLLARAFADLGSAPLADYHAHAIGIGTGDSGAELDPAMLDGWSPIPRLKAALFLSACGVKKGPTLDQDYMDRLTRLARGFPHPLKIHLLALDRYYGPDGAVDKSKVEFYMPNDYVVRLAEQHPDLYVPVISVHPDRPDALEELDRWAARGVRVVKWLPNCQGIDPSNPRYDPFYQAMKKHRLILLTHTGMEKSVGSGTQLYGNPLLLRRPLDQGVRVIMAHCASSGRNADLDHPGRTADNFDLFLRMMADDRYRGLLFADISALTQINRAPRPILELIRRPELHDRLVNGSDYPLPAMNCMIWTRQLCWRGLITDGERRALNDIYACNPLLFDFALKRTIRDPVSSAQLPARVFLPNPGLD